jgi:L-alanine-DL-glutamate epimerase-like enolase superfamily enzyme
MSRPDAVIEALSVSAHEIPTDSPESDGTLEWNSTTIVIAEASGGGERGVGYTYAAGAAAHLVAGELRGVVCGRDALDVGGAREAMLRACRNLGRPGLVSNAISAVDVALWDLKARLLGISLVDLLGAAREAIPAYGSGGFTSYSPSRLREQLGGWIEQGMSMVKMKVGREPEADRDRVRVARDAIGPGARLFVDANGAYSRKQALEKALVFRDHGVSWFEEPVSSDDLEGLRLIRDRAPAGMQVAAGEYGYDSFYFLHMLEAGAVDVLQADVSRCGGITGFLEVGSLCRARSMPLSAHTVPSVHGHLGCSVLPMRHIEYFHDHVRIERMIFDGSLEAENGVLRPHRGRPGLGLAVKRAEAAKYETFRSE